MTDKNAFPNITPDMHVDGGPGMSLREYYAGKALVGLLAGNATYGGRTDNRDELAKDAVAFADAMLVALL